jgi:MFS family permease
MALLAYVNSSMLGQFASANLISITYTLASILSLFFVSISPKIINRFGNFKYTTLGLLGSSVLLYMISSHSGLSIIPFFILYFSLNSVILYGLDLFLEHYSSESKTGNIRGMYLSLGNIGWVLAPVISSALRENFNFRGVYIASSVAVVVTLLVIFWGQRGFVDKIYKKSHFIDGFNVLRKNKELRNITLLNFLLQYLTSTLGFSWKTLGLILSAMLLPFVIFPYPTGRLADRFGEKKLMYLGLVIMFVATLVFANMMNTAAWMYALVLFITRVGASILETVCDSAFFKRVTDSDSAVISTYRSMMPIAYSIVPLIAGLIFALYSYQTLFSFIAIVMALSVIAVFSIKKVH